MPNHNASSKQRYYGGCKQHSTIVEDYWVMKSYLLIQIRQLTAVQPGSGLVDLALEFFPQLDLALVGEGGEDRGVPFTGFRRGFRVGGVGGIISSFH